MTLKSKNETHFELSVFKLCHVLNLIFIGIEMPERRGGEGGFARKGLGLIGFREGFCPWRHTVSGLTTNLP